MAENKKSFVLYADLIHTVDKMPSEKAGDLFKHILKYVNDMNPETEDLIIQLTFEPIKQQLKRDLKRWESKQEQRKQAGLRSAEVRRTKMNEDERPLTTVNEDEQTPTVNGNVTVNEIKENIYSLYPSNCIVSKRPTGKSKKKDIEKIGRLLKEHTESELTSIINRYLTECKNSQTYLKNFGTFLNNLPDYNQNELIEKKLPKWQCKKNGTHTQVFECETEDEAKEKYMFFGGCYPDEIKRL